MGVESFPQRPRRLDWSSVHSLKRAATSSVDWTLLEVRHVK